MTAIAILDGSRQAYTEESWYVPQTKARHLQSLPLPPELLSPLRLWQSPTCDLWANDHARLFPELQTPKHMSCAARTNHSSPALEMHFPDPRHRSTISKCQANWVIQPLSPSQLPHHHLSPRTRQALQSRLPSQRAFRHLTRGCRMTRVE